MSATDLAAHLRALDTALRAEQAADADEHARLDALPPDEQLAVGHAWPPLRLVDAVRDGPRVRVTVDAPRGVPLHDGIGAGDPVWLDHGGAAWPAVVDDVDPHRAELRLDRGRQALAPGVARVRRRHDPTTWQRYRAALRTAGARPNTVAAQLLAGPPAQEPGDADLAGLDAAQRRAAHHALHADGLALVWGPPGTGKTVLLGKVLAALVRRGERPWALADSNAAVDHLARTARAEGLDVVRLGPTSRIGADLADCRLDARIAASVLGPTLATLDRELVRAWGTPAAPRLLRERQALWEQARDAVLASAQVVATTFGTLARVAETLPAPTTAVVDEATQPLEPAVWVAVPHVERLVLAGDPAQLGPVVHVAGSPLEQSALQRLVAAGAPAPMLEVQHRMAPALRELVAPVYGPAYVDAPSTRQPPVLELPALWIDTAGAGAEIRDPVTRSLYEPVEIALVAQVVAALRAAGLDPADIGVIAPYSAQVSRLRAQLADVEVATVNAFQGRERDAIVASFVRANPDGELGFVADERRLTVSLTRARRQLVLIGDSGTLGRHPRFAAVLAHLADLGAIQSVWSPPWDAALPT
ncbi:MAG: AAA domain-containing protein [Myxococcota bacterium]